MGPQKENLEYFAQTDIERPIALIELEILKITNITETSKGNVQFVMNKVKATK